MSAVAYSDKVMYFYIEVKLNPERRGIIHCVTMSDTGNRTQRWLGFQRLRVDCLDATSYWRGDFWCCDVARDYAIVHGWEPELCPDCFPGVTAL